MLIYTAAISVTYHNDVTGIFHVTELGEHSFAAHSHPKHSPAIFLEIGEAQEIAANIARGMNVGGQRSHEVLVYGHRCQHAIIDHNRSGTNIALCRTAPYAKWSWGPLEKAHLFTHQGNAQQAFKALQRREPETGAVIVKKAPLVHPTTGNWLFPIQTCSAHP